MTDDEARHVELVRAVELEGREVSLLTQEDRAQADAYARRIRSLVDEPARQNRCFPRTCPSDITPASAAAAL